MTVTPFTTKITRNAHTFLREFRDEYGHLEIGNFTKQQFTQLTARFVKQGKGTKATRAPHIKTFYNWVIGVGVTEQVLVIMFKTFS